MVAQRSQEMRQKAPAILKISSVIGIHNIISTMFHSSKQSRVCPESRAGENGQYLSTERVSRREGHPEPDM